MQENETKETSADHTVPPMGEVRVLRTGSHPPPDRDDPGSWWRPTPPSWMTDPVLVGMTCLSSFVGASGTPVEPQDTIAADVQGRWHPAYGDYEKARDIKMYISVLQQQYQECYNSCNAEQRASIDDGGAKEVAR